MPVLMTRRTFALAAALAPALAARGAAAQSAPATTDAPAGGAPVFRTGVSLMGEPKYPAGFAHFDYVNPQAPKGGLLRLAEDGTFDSLNFVVPRGTPAAGLSLIYDTLMTSAFDEVASEYGLLAEGVSYPPDFSQVTYRLRENARWHDGTPITPADVVWSFETLVANNPNQRFYYSHVVKAEQTGPRDVTFTFDQAGNRELPQIVGQFIVLPKHWWTGQDASGKPRDVTQGTLETPLGSGAYRIKSMAPGRTIVYERVADYWGKDLPVNVGRNNFDEIRYEYFRDDTVMLEAFKADQYDFRVESSAKNWATAYDFPARKDGKVILEMFENRASGVMQAFIPNLRRAKFQDRRVRRALNYALDFEGMNHTLFFDQYTRISSFFSGTELAFSGLPEGRELEILNTVKGQVPQEVFTTAYTNPVSGNEEARRANLREAARLLKDAGYEVKNRKLVNAAGEPFTIEILLASPAMERVAVFYKPALERLGITVTVRMVDSSQYINRLRARDFDMIVSGWGQSLSPGNEQRDFFGAQAADREGSRNYAGIKDAAVDALIDKVIYATDRADLVAATHALDRVLMWNEFVIPAWTLNYTRTARWDRFSHPAPLPAYSFAFPDIWWFDAAKAAKIGGGK
ncbi:MULTISPECIES: extracellular solute-binding protein [unclassified Xanthobacter]|uniref:extracellular solute-binding protein n=1 Tax=unclassified Xanthobacter TaxID=2623496 RepID=UPI001EDED20C|nr:MULTISPECIES: extracellular solute-binding protein [unclassified Xanthobacter]